MIAIISDIHGNIHALDAVLKDMPKVSEIWVTGDIPGGGAFPIEVMERLLNLDVPVKTVMGNWEDGLIEAKNGLHPDWGKTKQFAGIIWTVKTLKPHHWDFLEALPRTLSLDSLQGGVLLYHGKPDNLSGTVFREEDAFELVKGRSERWFFGGHTHQARILMAGDKRVVVSGSVGASLDSIGGVACYALHDGEKVSIRHISYDVMAAVNAIKISEVAQLAPAISGAVAAILLTGRRYVDVLLTFAKAHAEKRLGSKVDDIPPEIWDEVEELWKMEDWLEDLVKF